MKGHEVAVDHELHLALNCGLWGPWMLWWDLGCVSHHGCCGGILVVLVHQARCGGLMVVYHESHLVLNSWVCTTNCILPWIDIQDGQCERIHQTQTLLDSEGGRDPTHTSQQLLMTLVLSRALPCPLSHQQELNFLHAKERVTGPSWKGG